MLVLHMPEIGIFLIIRKRHAQDVRQFDEVMEQGTASEFNIVGMRPKEQYFFAEEIQIVIRRGQRMREPETSQRLSL